jgi:hypothetical protein
LRVGQGVLEAWHEADVARGGLLDAFQDRANQVVRAVAVELAAQSQGDVDAQQFGAITVVVAGTAGAVEEALRGSGLG